MRDYNKIEISQQSPVGSGMLFGRLVRSFKRGIFNVTVFKFLRQPQIHVLKKLLWLHLEVFRLVLLRITSSHL